MLRTTLTYKIDKSTTFINNQNTKIKVSSFADKKVYIGIDVHRHSYSITCLCDGVFVKALKLPADPQLLIKYIKDQFPNAHIKTVYESGFSGFALHRHLTNAGIENIVIHAASLASSRNERVKNDTKDSRKLAEQFAAGMLKCIHIPSEAQELSRCYPRTRSQYVKKLTRLKMQIRMKILQYGKMPLDYNTVLTRKFVKQIIPTLPLELRITIEIMLESWEQTQLQILKLNKLIREQNAKCPINIFYKNLAGFGFVSSSILATELGDMSQFKNERSLFSYTGLTPKEFSSGERKRLGSISKQGNPVVRHILVEAAWRAIKKDPLLMDKFNTLASRVGRKRAIVAIARKLVGIARSTIINQTKYEVSYKAHIVS